MFGASAPLFLTSQAMSWAKPAGLFGSALLLALRPLGLLGAAINEQSNLFLAA